MDENNLAKFKKAHAQWTIVCAYKGKEQLLQLIINQSDLIKEISKTENISIVTVQKIFESIEKHIFKNLSLSDKTNSVTIKPFDGFSIECKYVPAKTMNTYGKIECKDKIWAKPRITRYYNRKLNNYFN